MSLIATSQKQLADTIGIGERTFATWLREGCPGETKHYVICDVVQWARENKWEGDPDGSLIDSIGDEDLKNRLIEQRIRKTEREIQLADFKIDERKSNLVDVSVVKRFLAEFAGRMRNAITTVEKKCGTGSCSPIRSAIAVSEKELNGGAIDISGP